MTAIPAGAAGVMIRFLVKKWFFYYPLLEQGAFMQADGVYGSDTDPFAIVPFVRGAMLLGIAVNVPYTQQVRGLIWSLFAASLIAQGLALDAINSPTSHFGSLLPSEIKARFAGQVTWITGASIIGFQVAIVAVMYGATLLGDSIAERIGRWVE